MKTHINIVIDGDDENDLHKLLDRKFVMKTHIDIIIDADDENDLDQLFDMLHSALEHEQEMDGITYQVNSQACKGSGCLGIEPTCADSN